MHFPFLRQDVSKGVCVLYKLRTHFILSAQCVFIRIVVQNGQHITFKGDSHLNQVKCSFKRFTELQHSCLSEGVFLEKTDEVLSIGNK